MTYPVDLGLLSFDEACAMVVDFLKLEIPLGFWSVSRHLDDRQVYLHLRDEVYGKEAGGSHAWSDSFCQFMVTGQTPQIAPRAMSIPLYAGAGVAQALTIGAYVGIPIRAADGLLFGTICGLDPEPRTDDLLEHAPMLRLLAALLSQILQADRLRAEATEREAELRWHAFHDPLTELANRTLFGNRLGHAMDLQRRDLRAIAVLLVDLDGFKLANDSHGHALGDQLLVQVAARLRRCLRAGDTAARLGGDEFAILIEDGGRVEVIARKIVNILGAPFTLSDTTVTIGASVGVASVAPFPTVDADAILSRADAAMYEAKRAGGSRFAVYRDPTPAATRAVSDR